MRLSACSLTVFAWLSAGLFGLGQASVSQAIAPENVLVLYNADDGTTGPGFQIATEYQNLRPGVHVRPLNGINSMLTGPTNEDISGADYLDPTNGIRRQVLDLIDAIPDRIDVIVTTKGLPLRINSGGIDDDDFEPWSSLESELTRIDEIDTIAEMQNQVAEIDLGFIKIPQPPKNPYFNANAPFVHTGSDPFFADIRLASRLDGRTVDDVITALEKSKDVYIVPNEQFVVVDDDPNNRTDELTTIPGESGFGPGPGVTGVYDAQGNLITPGALELHDQAFVYNNDDTAITTAPGQVIGYASHGIHDGGGGLESDYILSQLQFDIAPGAVFNSYESFNASSFDPNFTQNQGLIADWLAIGGSAAMGNVTEPENTFVNVTNEDLFYNMILPAAGAAAGESGLTFVEAAWNATYQLSYVNTVVGDPLMRWKVWTPGDIDLNGIVDGNDAGILFQNWGQSGHLFNGGNFDGNDIIDAGDFTVMSVNWSMPQPASAAFAVTVTPEPSSLLLAAFGLCGLIASGRRFSNSRSS